MNVVVLTGRLTKDIELKKTQSGTSVVNFTIAVNRLAKAEGQPEADFINCQAWGKTADNMAFYLRKGALIGVHGSIQVSSYENNQGQKVYVTKVIANTVQFLEPRGSVQEQNQQGNTNTYHEQESSAMKPKYDHSGITESLDIENDDLPF